MARTVKEKIRVKWSESSRVDDGGRQENSLRTVRYNSEVLYTNTGWSVHS